MFEGAYSQLHPLRACAHILAQKNDWPRLYDTAVLSQCHIPCAAVVYYDDMYVDLDYSVAVANSIPGLKCWITNEYQHSGLRDDGYRILDRYGNISA
jgi:hypothetical protein